MSAMSDLTEAMERLRVVTQQTGENIRRLVEEWCASTQPKPRPWKKAR